MTHLFCRLHVIPQGFQDLPVNHKQETCSSSTRSSSLHKEVLTTKLSTSCKTTCPLIFRCTAPQIPKHLAAQACYNKDTTQKINSIAQPEVKIPWTTWRWAQKPCGPGLGASPLVFRVLGVDRVTDWNLQGLELVRCKSFRS